MRYLCKTIAQPKCKPNVQPQVHPREHRRNTETPKMSETHVKTYNTNKRHENDTELAHSHAPLLYRITHTYSYTHIHKYAPQHNAAVNLKQYYAIPEVPHTSRERKRSYPEPRAAQQTYFPFPWKIPFLRVYTNLILNSNPHQRTRNPSSRT